MQPGTLYVIQDRQTSLIKIGISNNWALRLKSLKVGIKTKLKIAIKTNGNREWEKMLHQQYANWRLVGTEWFNLDETLLEELLNKVVNIAEMYEAGEEVEALRAIRYAKRQKQLLINEEKRREEKTAKAFCLANMRLKILQQWKKEGYSTEPLSNSYEFNDGIYLEAEFLYRGGFRVNSNFEWCKVAPDGKWIKCEEHETSF
jgi:hypothetical protein